MSEELEEVKEKITIKIGLPKSGVSLSDLDSLFTKMNEATTNFEVIVSISTSST